MKKFEKWNSRPLQNFTLHVTAHFFLGLEDKKKVGMLETVDDIIEEETPDATISMNSRIENLIEGGIDAAKWFGRGINAVSLHDLKGIWNHLIFFHLMHD